MYNIEGFVVTSGVILFALAMALVMGSAEAWTWGSGNFSGFKAAAVMARHILQRRDVSATMALDPRVTFPLQRARAATFASARQESHGSTWQRARRRPTASLNVRMRGRAIERRGYADALKEKLDRLVINLPVHKTAEATENASRWKIWQAIVKHFH